MTCGASLMVNPPKQGLPPPWPVLPCPCPGHRPGGGDQALHLLSKKGSQGRPRAPGPWVRGSRGPRASTSLACGLLEMQILPSLGAGAASQKPSRRASAQL